jgi:glycosylphosphatidylinositol transamidase
MLIAINFSIAAMALWVKSGRTTEPVSNPAATKPKKASTEKSSSADIKTAENETTKDELKKKDTDSKMKQPEKKEESASEQPATELVEQDGSLAVVPKASTTITERHLLLPLVLVLTAHASGLIPLYLFNNWDADHLPNLFLTASNLTTLAPLIITFLFWWSAPDVLTPQALCLLQCFSLLLLGMFLAALATLNFSLSVLVGVLCVPLSFVRKSNNRGVTGVQLLMLAMLNPVLVIQTITKLLGANLTDVLVQSAIGWHVWGMWTQVVVWLVWFPAWLAGAVVVSTGFWE